MVSIACWTFQRLVQTRSQQSASIGGPVVRLRAVAVERQNSLINRNVVADTSKLSLDADTTRVVR